MADSSLMSKFTDNFLHYVGVSEVFPEIRELLELERSLKLVNVQVSSSIRGINTFRVDGTNTFRDLSRGAKEYSGAISSVEKRTLSLQNSISLQAMALGTNMDTMIELTRASSDYGIILDGRVSSAMTMFTEATGISTYTLGEFTAKMLSSGKIQQGETEGFLTNILKVREQYGFATEDLYSLFNITERYANIVGVTGDKLKQSSAEIAKFIALTKQAGLEADFASDVLDKLFDPLRAQENMTLLSKLGVTIEDVAFGDLEKNMEEIGPRLKSLSEEILTVPGRLAQAKLAEVYGMTLEQVTKLSQMELDRAELSREKTLKQYREETHSAIQTLTVAKDQAVGLISLAFNNTIGRLIKFIGPWSVLFIGPLVAKIKSGVGKLFNPVRASLSGAVEEGFTSGINKALVASEGRLREFTGVKGGFTPPTRTGATRSDTLLDVETFLSGGRTTTSARYRAGRMAGQERRAERRGVNLGPTPDARGLVEQSRSEILRIEAYRESLEAMKNSGALNNKEFNRLSSLLSVSMGNELEKYNILLQSSEIRTKILDEINTIDSELSQETEMRKILKERLETAKKEKEIALDELKKLEGDERKLSLENITKLDTEIKLLKEEGARYDERIAKKEKDLEMINVNAYSSIGGKAKGKSSDASVEDVIKEYMGYKPSPVSGPGKKMATNIDKLTSAVAPALPRLGGTLGRIVGNLGGITPALGMLGPIAGSIGLLIATTRKMALKNEEIAKDEERLIKAFKEGVETFSKPITGIYGKVVKLVADSVDNKEEKTLEDYTKAYIIKQAKDENETNKLLGQVNDGIKDLSASSNRTSRATETQVKIGLRAQQEVVG